MSCANYFKEMERSKSFDDLGISTKTVMVYGNIEFDIEKLYNEMPITIVDVPLTKKKKLPDMKKVIAPYNTIISLRYKNEFRGIATKQISKEEKSSNYFLNQVTCILSLGEKNLHIMVFKNKLKIAGSKETDQAFKAVELLWKHICKVKDGFKMKDKNPPKFIFDTVMTNVDFKLGFKIDRKKLNNLMNDYKYRNLVHMSRFETTGNTNVNIKMHCIIPENFKYDCMTIEHGKKPKFSKVPENLYDDKKTKKKEKYTTFLVFRSSKVIESGRFYESMKNGYNYFIDIINQNKDSIEEKIKADGETYVHQEAIKSAQNVETLKRWNLPPQFELQNVIKNIQLQKKKISDYPVSLHKLIKSIPEKCPKCRSKLWWKETYMDDVMLICGKCNCNVMNDISEYVDIEKIEIY